MRSNILIGILTVIFAICICVYFVLKEGITITVTEAEIQNAVNKKFPMDKTHLLIFKVIYSDPIVEVLDNKNRIRIGITATPAIKVNGKEYSGSAVVNGGFRYEPKSGEVFLTGFAVEKLALGEHQGLKLEKISDSLSECLEEVFARHPVYTLNDNDLKQKTAKMLVKNVKIINKAVTITLGL